ncbi:MAG TPA: hypothetical protein VFS43_00975 [Polyangiaceae bacterium]|nr:hypothetical protein [Polyangiaceae bacterium]
MGPTERPPRDEAAGSENEAHDEGRRADEPREGRRSEPPPEPGRAEGPEGVRRLLERIIREGVRRVVEKGVGQITDGPENLRQFVGDMRLPKEAAFYLLQQIDETKNGLYRAVARELRDFLEHTNLSEELTRALTTLSFEVKMEIRFIPNDQKFEGGEGRRGTAPKPDVRTSVRVRETNRD